MADASLGVAVFRTSLDASGLKTGLAQARSETDQTVRHIDQRLESIGQGMQRLGSRMSLFVTAPLAAIGAAGVRSAMQLETFATSLEVLIGDAERAQGVFEELYEFSASTTFEWKSLMEGTRVLAAFGTEAEDIVPTLSRLGDIAAGLQTPIEDLAQIFGRVQVTGRLGMEEVNRLADRGVPIYTELAKVIGTSEAGVRDLVSAGKVGFPELEAVIRNLTSEGGMFFGMMEAQTQTVEGRFMRLKDSFEQVTDIVGERLLPTFDRLIAAGQRATDWFVNLDESTQQWIIGLGAGLAASGPILVGVGTLVIQIPKVVAGFQALRTAMLPFLGPVGILAGAVAGYIALNEAMNAGRAERAQASADFQDLVRQMGAYRDQLVITGEEERQQLIASLERRREALIRVAQMNEAMIRQMESEVIAFANMPWWQQLFNFGATNVTLDALDKAEADLRAVRRELDAIDTQIGQVRVMEITPNVTPPPPVAVDVAVNLTGAGAEALSDPAAAAKRWVERLEAELRFGMKGPSEVIDLLSPRVEELREDATNALAEFGIDSQQYQDTVAKLDVLEAALGRIGDAAKISLSITPTASVAAAVPLGIAALPDPLDQAVRLFGDEAAETLARATRSANVQAARDQMAVNARNREAARAIAADTEEAMADAAAAHEEYLVAIGHTDAELARFKANAAGLAAVLKDAADEAARMELFASAQARYGIGDTGLAGTSASARGGIGITREQLNAQAADVARDTVLAVTEAYLAGAASIDDVQTAVDALTTLTPLSVKEINDLTQGVLQLERAANNAAGALQRAQDFEERGTTDLSIFRPFLTPEQQAFNERMGARQHRPRQDNPEDLANAKRIYEERAKAEERFKDTIISAGLGFADTLARGIQTGDMGSIVSGGFGAIGSIIGAIPNIGTGLTVLSGLLPIFGNILGGLFGGDRNRELEQRRQAEASRARSVPAININFTVTQHNQYNGAPSDPRNEQAFARQADQLFESLYKRHLGPRLESIERRLGMTGAGA